MYHSALTLPAELSMSGTIGLWRVSSTALMARPAAPTARFTSAALSRFIRSCSLLGAGAERAGQPLGDGGRGLAADRPAR